MNEPTHDTDEVMAAKILASFNEQRALRLRGVNLSTEPPRPVTYNGAALLPLTIKPETDENDQP